MQIAPLQAVARTSSIPALAQGTWLEEPRTDSGFSSGSMAHGWKASSWTERYAAAAAAAATATATCNYNYK